MSFPADTSYDLDTYIAYSNHLMGYLFPERDLGYLLQRAKTNHQANRLIMHLIIRKGGPEDLLENYIEYTDVITENWKIIKDTILIQKNRFKFGGQVAIHLNLHKINSVEREPLTFEQQTVWKDLCSYRNWAWKKGRMLV